MKYQPSIEVRDIPSTALPHFRQEAQANGHRLDVVWRSCGRVRVEIHSCPAVALPLFKLRPYQPLPPS